MSEFKDAHSLIYACTHPYAQLG